MAKIALELHSNTVAELAEDISCTKSFEDFCSLARTHNNQIYQDAIMRLRESWKDYKDVSPIVVAAGLRAALETAALKEKQESLDLVWTGPNTGLVPCIYTEQVLIEVITAAKDRVFLVSFVGYDIGTVRNALNTAAERHVRIDILLESSVDEGGKLNIDSIGTYKGSIPSAHVYTWHPSDVSTSKWNGVVHAKCAVSDGQLAFVTSANLSRAAMERNMELGVLVRGGSLPEKLDRHLAALVATGIVKRV